MFKKIAVAGLLALGAGAAVAGPIQPSFNFTTTGAFVGATCVNDGVAPFDCSITGVGSQLLKWGTPTNPWNHKSALNVVNSGGTYGRNYNHDGDFSDLGEGALGTIGNTLVTNGGWGKISAFEHFNNIIDGGQGNIGLASIMASLTIPGVALPPPWGAGGNLVNFTETPNKDTCDGLNPLNTFCDDFFTGLALEEPYYFWKDGFTYKLSLRFTAGPGAYLVADGKTVIDGVEFDKWVAYTSEPCIEFDANGKCTRFARGAEYTFNQYRPGYSVIFTEARIDVVPEPGSLALIGLGLLGLGLRRRMKA